MKKAIMLIIISVMLTATTGCGRKESKEVDNVLTENILTENILMENILTENIITEES